MKKDFIFAIICTLLVIVLLLNTDIKPVDEFYSLHPDQITEDSEYAILTIECKNILLSNNDISQPIPSDGVILDETKYVLNDNETVFDLLSKALTYEKVSFDYSGSRRIYINGIADIYEFEYGVGSGWVYTVNGVSPEVDCGSYALKSGDSVVFSYVCDDGEVG